MLRLPRYKSVKEIDGKHAKELSVPGVGVAGWSVRLLRALCDRDKRKGKKGKALPHKLYFGLISELLKLTSPPFLLRETKYVKKHKNLI